MLWAYDPRDEESELALDATWWLGQVSQTGLGNPEVPGARDH